MEKKIGRDPETERVTNIVYRVNGSPIAAYAYGAFRGHVSTFDE